MKQFLRYFLLFSICIICLSSCTQNMRAKMYGGTAIINVEAGYKVTNATFKETQIWYFIEPMEDGYIPKEKKLIESSGYGIIEGEIIFKETR